MDVANKSASFIFCSCCELIDAVLVRKNIETSSLFVCIVNINQSQWRNYRGERGGGGDRPHTTSGWPSVGKLGFSVGNSDIRMRAIETIK